MESTNKLTSVAVTWNQLISKALRLNTQHFQNQYYLGYSIIKSILEF